REGTEWTAKIMRRIEQGEGTEDDLDTLHEVGRNMTGTTICVLSDSCAAPVASSIAKFREEYIARIRREVRADAVTVGGDGDGGDGQRTLPHRRRRGDGPEGDAHHRGSGAGRHRDRALLLSSGPLGAGNVPHVPGRGGGRTEAAAGVCDDGRG